jgi:hypothetical protein
VKRLAFCLALAAASALTSCTHTAPDRGIQHVVVIWLKEPGNAAQRDAVVAASRSFRRIPGVQDLTVGTCVPGNRPIIDGTYDVALSMRFADAAALQRYIDHPDHRAAADSLLKPLARKVVVYDFSLR